MPVPRSIRFVAKAKLLDAVGNCAKEEVSTKPWRLPLVGKAS